MPTAGLAKFSRESAVPLEFSAERAGDTAHVKLVMVGKYEAAFSVTAAAE